MNWLNKIWMTQRKLQTMRREIEKEQLVSRTERHSELCLFRTGDEMQGRPCNLYLGYVADYDGLFERIMPIAFDVIAESLKGYSVYTQITPTGLSHQPPCVPPETHDLIACYVEKIQMNDVSRSKVFYDGDVSFITFSQGIDLKTMDTFCGVETSRHFENEIYGFARVPINLPDSYVAIADFLESNQPEVAFSIHREHIGLDIRVKPYSAVETQLLSKIIAACEKYCEPLHIYFT